MENNVVVDHQLLGQAIKALLKESGISSKKSVSSVSGQGALVVRVIEVPKMSDAELGETMRWEVERHVPFAANEVIMDFQPIPRPDDPPDAQNMEVLLAVAQQDMVDRHVDMLKAAGLKPLAIDVEPLAAARCLIELGPDPYGQKTVAIVNIGASNTDIGIFRDGLLSFPRTLPLAGDSLTRAVMQYTGSAAEQAEGLKKEFGEISLMPVQQASATPDDFLDFSTGAPAPAADRMPFDFSVGEDDDPGTALPTAVTAPSGVDDSPFDIGEDSEPVAEPTVVAVAPEPVALVPSDPRKEQVFGAIAPVLSELVTELRRSLEYYRGRSVDGRIDEILVCGGTANLKGIDKFLEGELGVPTRVADPFQFATPTSKHYSPEYLHEIAPAFAVAVGLAARDFIQGPPAPKAPKKKRGKS
jgi:type IV pilus assembly protein PilM